MRTGMLATVLAGLLLAGTARAHDEVAPVVFLTLEGVTGDATEAGHEGQLRVFRYGETWRVPTSGGQVSGRAQLGPVVFTKAAGRGTFELKKLLTTSRVVPKATFEFYDLAEGRKLKLSAKVTFTSVRVVAVTEQTGEGRRTDEVQLLFSKGRWEVLDPADAFDFDAVPSGSALTGGAGAPTAVTR